MYTQCPPRYFDFLITCRTNYLRWLELCLCLVCLIMAIAIWLTNVHLVIKLLITIIPLVLAVVVLFDIVSNMNRCSLCYGTWIMIALAAFLTLCLCAGLLMFLKRNTKKYLFIFASVLFLLTAFIFLFDYIWTAIEYCKMRDCCKIGPDCCEETYNVGDGDQCQQPMCYSMSTTSCQQPMCYSMSTTSCQQPMCYNMSNTSCPSCMPLCPPCASSGGEPCVCPEPIWGTPPPGTPYCVCEVPGYAVCPKRVQFQTYRAAVNYSSPHNEILQDFSPVEKKSSQLSAYVTPSPQKRSTRLTENNEISSSSKCNFNETRNNKESYQLPKFKNKLPDDIFIPYYVGHLDKKLDKKYHSKLDPVPEYSARSEVNENVIDRRKKEYLKPMAQTTFKTIKRFFSPRSSKSVDSIQLDQSEECQTSKSTIPDSRECISCKKQIERSSKRDPGPIDIVELPSTSTANPYNNIVRKDNKIYPSSSTEHKQILECSRIPRPLNLSSRANLKKSIRTTDVPSSPHTDGLTYRLENRVTHPHQRAATSHLNQRTTLTSSRKKRDTVSEYDGRRISQNRTREQETEIPTVSRGETHVSSPPPPVKVLVYNNSSGRERIQNPPAEGPSLCCNCANKTRFKIQKNDGPVYVYCTCGKCR